MRLRSGQPCVRSYHSVGTREYRLSIPVFRNSGRSRPTSGDCPNKSLTRHHAAAVGEVPPEVVAVPMIDAWGPASTRQSLLSPAAFGSSPTTPISGICYAIICRGSCGPSTGSCGWKRQSRVSRATWRMIMISTVSCCRAARAIVIMAPPIAIRDSSLIPIGVLPLQSRRISLTSAFRVGD
jgi:hypothetical protein